MIYSEYILVYHDVPVCHSCCMMIIQMANLLGLVHTLFTLLYIVYFESSPLIVSDCTFVSGEACIGRTIMDIELDQDECIAR